MSKHHFVRFQGKFGVQEKSEAESYSIHSQTSFSLLYSATKGASETPELTSSTIVSNNKDFREFKQLKTHEYQPDHCPARFEFFKSFFRFFDPVYYIRVKVTFFWSALWQLLFFLTDSPPPSKAKAPCTKKSDFFLKSLVYQKTRLFSKIFLSTALGFF